MTTSLEVGTYELGTLRTTTEEIDPLLAQMDSLEAVLLRCYKNDEQAGNISSLILRALEDLFNKAVSCIVSQEKYHIFPICSKFRTGLRLFLSRQVDEFVVTQTAPNISTISDEVQEWFRAIETNINRIVNMYGGLFGLWLSLYARALSIMQDQGKEEYDQDPAHEIGFTERLRTYTSGLIQKDSRTLSYEDREMIRLERLIHSVEDLILSLGSTPLDNGMETCVSSIDIQIRNIDEELEIYQAQQQAKGKIVSEGFKHNIYINTLYAIAKLIVQYGNASSRDEQQRIQKVMQTKIPLLEGAMRRDKEIAEIKSFLGTPFLDIREIDINPQNITPEILTALERVKQLYTICYADDSEYLEHVVKMLTHKWTSEPSKIYLIESSSPIGDEPFLIASYKLTIKPDGTGGSVCYCSSMNIDPSFRDFGISEITDYAKDKILRDDPAIVAFEAHTVADSAAEKLWLKKGWELIKKNNISLTDKDGKVSKNFNLIRFSRDKYEAQRRKKVTRSRSHEITEESLQ